MQNSTFDEDVGNTYLLPEFLHKFIHKYMRQQSSTIGVSQQHKSTKIPRYMSRNKDTRHVQTCCIIYMGKYSPTVNFTLTQK